ncbi:MAG: 50S ribosomal protein L6 [Candidatus Bathyarchaeia archaeon]
MEARTVSIPENVKVTLCEGKTVSVTGPLGKVEADFSHARDISIQVEGNVVSVQVQGQARRRKVALAGTVAAHIRNMIVGVTKGFTYKLKIVYAHFPMSVKVQRDKLIIENFAGERRPRAVKILGDVKVSVETDDVIVKGIDIRTVGQTAANIEQATRVKSKDPRVFLDGIFLYEKSEGI